MGLTDFMQSVLWGRRSLHHEKRRPGGPPSVARPEEPAVSPTAVRRRSDEASDPEFCRQSAPAAKKPSALSVELLTAFRLLSGSVHADLNRQFVPVPRKPPTLSIELLTAFRLLSATAQTDLNRQFVPVPRKAPALSVELLTAFRLLSGTVQADRAKQPPSIGSARADDHAVLVEASQTDFASAIRAIDGVQKVTRQIGGLWLVASDRDIRSVVARQVIQRGGELTLLVGRAAVSRLPSPHQSASKP